MESPSRLSVGVAAGRDSQESWQSNGHPKRTDDEPIPLLARIIALADAFVAMITGGDDRPGLSVEQAFAVIGANAGNDFDADCVQALLRLRPRIEAWVQQRKPAVVPIPMLILMELAYHDALTGLPNRRLLADRLGQAIAQAQRQGRWAAIMVLDLDGFKRMNDAFGHGVGDGVLQVVAHRLQDSVRKMDTVARVGGDEFTLVLGGLAGTQDAALVAQKILDLVARPLAVESHRLSVTASVGVSLYPVDAIDAETLLKQADLALYRAKAKGKNTFSFFRYECTLANGPHIDQR